MKKYLRLLLKVLCLAAVITATRQSPVFLVDPVSITAVDGTTVEFSCTANNTEEVSYRVNGSSTGDQDVEDKGFVKLGAEVLGGTIRRTNLTVAVSSQYNNTKIFCRAIGSDVNVNSETANLTVQGPLSSVGDLSNFFIDSYTVNISWSPPFTLPGTAITGYNISTTCNGTTANYFTSDYVLELSNITDSPCNEINITVSGYNGLNGETESLSNIFLPSVPSSDVDIPVRIDVTSSWHLSLSTKVTHLCIGEFPSTIDVVLFSNGTLVDSIDNVLLPQDTDTNILTVNTTLTVLEDQIYTAVVSFSNLAGEFMIESISNFSTFGIQSVVITDTTGGRVCLQCSFSSFSTDTGCTVELVSSGRVQYTETFNRSGNTAEGCVSGVTTGQYDIRVYDSSSFSLVHEETDVTVMLRSLPSATGMSSPSASRVTMTTPSQTVSLTTEAPEKKSRNLIPMLTGLLIGSVVIIIVAAVILFSFLWIKNAGQKKLKIVNQPVYAVPLKEIKMCDVSKVVPDSGNHVHVPEPGYAVPADNIEMCSASKKMLDGTKYVEIAEIEKRDRPLPGILADTTVPYSMVYFEGQPPPPPYKRTTDCQVDKQILEKGVILDKSCEDSDEYEQPPPIPPRTDYSLDDHITLEQQGFKDDSLYPERDEVTAF